MADQPDLSDLSTPVSSVAAPAMSNGGAEPSLDGLSTPVPPIPESEWSPAEKLYRAHNNSMWLHKLAHSVSFGLNDKLAALTPAAVHAAAKGVNGLYKESAMDVPFPEAEGENFSDIYHQRLDELRGATGLYSAAHPVASGVADVAGTAASMALPLGNALRGETVGAKVLGGAKGGAAIGGASGFGQSNDESLTKDLVSTGVGATVGGAVGGAATYAGEKFVAPVANWIAGKFGSNVLDNASNKEILKEIANSKSGGGPTAQDMLDLIKNNPDKPLMLMNAGGEPVKGLAERIVTTPGAGRQIGVKALKDQDAGAGVRLGGDIDNVASPPAGASGTGSNYSVAKDLSDIQKATSTPAYKKAFDGGSLAPLEDQFRKELIAATGVKGQIAKKISDIEKNNPGALASRGAAGADTRATYMDLHSQLEKAEADRQSIMQRFQQAQADKTANAPGAVWSPKLQEFMDDPVMKSGLQHGIESQRLETVGTDTPFNPTEHAIVGTNPDGTFQVGAVPNMRLVDAGKRGLDHLIGMEEVAPGKFTERGRILIGFKDRFLNEVDRLNPDYAPARAAFSGPAASKRAIAMGEYAMTSGKVHPDQITDQLAKLDAGDQELYKLGAMNALKTQIGNATPGGNEALRIMGTQNIKDRITAIAGSKDKADQLIHSANLEDLMKTDNTNVSGNSRTMLRAAQQASNADGGVVGDVAQMAGGIVTGEPVLSGMSGMRLVGKIWRGMQGVTPEVDTAIAKKLFNTKASENQDTLARIIAMGQKPSYAPLMARPLAQAGSQVIPRIMNMPLLSQGGDK